MATLEEMLKAREDFRKRTEELEAQRRFYDSQYNQNKSMGSENYVAPEGVFDYVSPENDPERIARIRRHQALMKYLMPDNGEAELAKFLPPNSIGVGNTPPAQSYSADVQSAGGLLGNIGGGYSAINSLSNAVAGISEKISEKRNINFGEKQNEYVFNDAQKEYIANEMLRRGILPAAVNRTINQLHQLPEKGKKFAWEQSYKATQNQAPLENKKMSLHDMFEANMQLPWYSDEYGPQKELTTGGGYGAGSLINQISSKNQISSEDDKTRLMPSFAFDDQRKFTSQNQNANDGSITDNIQYIPEIFGQGPLSDSMKANELENQNDNKQFREVITDVAGDKSAGEVIAPTKEEITFPLGQDYIDQFGSGKALTDLNNAKKFTKKIQETEAKSPGFVKRMLSNPNLFPYLAIAFNTMRLEPDNALTGAMMKTIETNNEFRKANRTAAWFRSQGTPEGEKAARYIEAGGTGKEAMDLFMPKYSLNTRVVADPKTNERKLITVSDQGIVKEIPLPKGFEPEGATRTIDLGTKYAIQDSGTGGIIAVIEKDVAGEAEQKEIGKFTGEQKAQAPKNFVTAQNQFNVIMDLLNHPNFEDVFGFLQGRLFTLTPGATDAEQYLKQIEGAAFLQAFETLKGGGQITEKEGNKATQALARLSTAQSEEAAEQALLELAEILINAMNQSKLINPEKIGDAVIPSLPKRKYAKGRDLDGRPIKSEDEVIPFDEL